MNRAQLENIWAGPLRKNKKIHGGPEIAVRKAFQTSKPLPALDGGFARSGTPEAEPTAKELLHDKMQSLKAEQATVYFTTTVAFMPAPRCGQNKGAILDTASCRA